MRTKPNKTVQKSTTTTQVQSTHAHIKSTTTSNVNLGIDNLGYAEKCHAYAIKCMYM